MEMLEGIASALFEKDDKCPFKEKEQAGGSEEAENIIDDDRVEVEAEQANNGGVLGGNLEAGSPGTGGTWCEPYGPADYLHKAARPVNPSVFVPAGNQVSAKPFPVTTAAHHLIPGNASLKKSKIYDYLGPPGSGEGKGKKRQAIAVRGKKYEITRMIGYNVNGSHNGVWLPGNYAIRAYAPAEDGRPERLNTSPVGGEREGTNWGKLSEKDFADWKFNYVAAATRAVGGQFHDTHTKYSTRVLNTLNKIVVALNSHLCGGDCEYCGNLAKGPPPYVVKMRLYGISASLRGMVTAGVERWKAPYFTSDLWSGRIFLSKASHRAFMLARRASQMGPSNG